jgi:hypothetical protein
MGASNKRLGRTASPERLDTRGCPDCCPANLDVGVREVIRMSRCIWYRLVTICAALCLLSCSRATDHSDLAVASFSAPSTIRPDETLEIGITVTNGNASSARIYTARLEYDIIGTAPGGISQTQTSTVWAGSTDRITFALSMAGIQLTASDEDFQPRVDITYEEDRKTISTEYSLGQITIEK